VFDKEFAKEQIKVYLTADLINIFKKKNSGEYVAEYYEMVKEELKKRGEKPEELEKAETKEEITALDAGHELSHIISKSLKEKLNIENLELEDLVQLYVWESKSPYFMALVEGELIRRGEDVKKHVKPGPAAEDLAPGTKLCCCDSCGKELKAEDNFCAACGNPKPAE